MHCNMTTRYRHCQVSVIISAECYQAGQNVCTESSPLPSCLRLFSYGQLSMSVLLQSNGLQQKKKSQSKAKTSHVVDSAYTGMMTRGCKAAGKGKAVQG